MSEERRRIDLRGLRLGRPDPHLRTRTLAAARAELRAALDASEPTGLRRWREWRLEAALAAGIAACALLLPAFGRLPVDLRPPSPASRTAISDSEAVVDQLGFDDLKPYFRLRQAIARRLPEPEPRYPDHERLRELHLDRG